ncbi:hypothetical protein TPA0910_30080 [Streptomyces hygroscopicus subsp. sporocinereus]|uniref:Uncharacterized protein n=1 Tax=Streptomyces hygroscopicus TaxID=1912 RepID=A0ABQ3TYX2_STRHY|nr:DUF6093 family protein [Streptomyces hygroscopicus]GHJ28575.1 hypothetical protein TPA0910_30080 [Streptomyces hygroscopicus]
MAFDVDGARRVVGRILDDKLEVWRDGAGRTDDVLDETTGKLVPHAPDEGLVWDGLGAVMPLGRPALTQPVSGSVAVEPPITDYQAVLPVDAPVLRRDDVIRVAGSVRPEGARDPQLVGRRFRVSDEAVGTYSVVRIIRVQVID